MHNLVDLSDLYFSEEDIEKMWVVIYYLIGMVFTINEKLYWNFPLIPETNDSVRKCFQFSDNFSHRLRSNSKKQNNWDKVQNDEKFNYCFAYDNDFSPTRFLM